METRKVEIFHNVKKYPDRFTKHEHFDPMVKVFEYEVPDACQSAMYLAEQVFRIGNGHPSTINEDELSRSYYKRELRSVSVGDVIRLDGTAFMGCESFGWGPVGSINDITATHEGEHGTEPLREGEV